MDAESEESEDIFREQTGKAKDINLYTAEVCQRDGPGAGKEKVGIGALALSMTEWATCATGCRATCFKFWHGRCWTLLTRIPLT